MAKDIINLFTDRIFPATTPGSQTENRSLKSLLFSQPSNKGEAEAAINHITGKFVEQQNSVRRTATIKNLGDDEPQKTVSDFYKEVLEKQPFDAENLAKKKISIVLEAKKPATQMTITDYDMAKDRAFFKEAGYSMLTNEEIQMAVSAIKSNGSVNHGGDTLNKLQRIDNQPGAMFITTDKATIEYAKRAGQAVLQYQEYKAKQSDANQEKARSETNQMLLDPLRLGGNAPFRWTERLFNTPRDILQQIDKGDIIPGSATGKWLGGKIAEQITGQPAPQMPTMSESVENLTGTKLPSIPEIKVPRPFEYQTEKYKREGKIGEEIGATAIDLFLLKRGIIGKSTATPKSLGNLNISKVFRVQGGIPPKASKFRIFIGESGEMVVKDKTKLFVTFDDMNRVKVFSGVNRAGKAEVISFEVKTSFVQQVRKFAVPQEKARMFSKLPEISDKTKTNSSFGLPLDWIEQLKASSIRGTGKIEQLQAPEPLYKLFPAVTTSNQLKEQPK
jgi:hypothetical protein